MEKAHEPKDVEQLLAEADELLQGINSEVIADMAQERRAQLEEHAQNLKKLKSDVQGKLAGAGTSTSLAQGEGMHEAILDIVKAMESLKSYLS
jgi:hypothetical protein